MKSRNVDDQMSKEPRAKIAEENDGPAVHDGEKCSSERRRCMQRKELAVYSGRSGTSNDTRYKQPGVPAIGGAQIRGAKPTRRHYLIHSLCHDLLIVYGCAVFSLLSAIFMYKSTLLPFHLLFITRPIVYDVRSLFNVNSRYPFPSSMM